MKKIILGLLMVAVVAPAAAFAYQPIDTDKIDVSQFTTVEQLQELRVLLMKQIIAILQIKVQELIALRDGTTPAPLVLGAATSTIAIDEDEEEEPRRRRGGGGGGGSSRSSSSNDSSNETTETDTSTTTEDGTSTTTPIVPTCTITSDFSVYLLGEEIELTWESTDAVRAYFETDFGGKDYQTPPENGADVATSGTAVVINNIAGNPTIQLNVVSIDDEENDCSVTFAVDGPTPVSDEELVEMVDSLQYQVEELGGDTSGAYTQEELDEMMTEELQQLISDLLSQIAQLQESETNDELATVCPFAWTRDLILGSEGPDVLKLQQFLNSDPDTRVAAVGESSIGDETEFYTDLVVTAVSKFQVKYREEILTPYGLVNPTGEFDAATRAKANSMCVQSDIPDGDPQLQTFTLKDIGGYVEAGAQYIAVAEFDVQFTGGDAEVEEVELRLSDTGNTLVSEAFSSMSLWAGGVKLTEVSLDEDSYAYDVEDDYTSIYIHDIGFSSAELETNSILIAVSSHPYLSEGVTADWTVSVEALAYLNGKSGFKNDTSTGDLGGAPVGFIVVGTDAEELDFVASASDPDPTYLNVDDATKVEYSIFAFDLEAPEGDVYVNKAVVRVDTSLGDIKEVIDDASLLINGFEYYADDYVLIGDSGTAAYYMFDLAGLPIESSDAREVQLVIEFNDTDSGINYTVPQTITASIDAETRMQWEAEGIYKLNPLSQFSGSVSGNTHTIMTEGLIIESISTQADVTQVDGFGSYGEFTIEFEVTAIEDNFYFTDNATTGAATDGIVYRVDGSTSAHDTTAVITSTADEDSQGVFVVKEGETETVNLTVLVSPSETGNYRLVLEDVLHSNFSDGITNVQSVQLIETDFRTHIVTLIKEN